MPINKVDICCGLAWGDEAKGKIIVHLCKNNNYDFVCRWAGGNNAGHTIYINKIKYVCNLIPSGIFYGVKSIIGPDCVLHIDSFFKEVEMDLTKLSKGEYLVKVKTMNNKLKVKKIIKL